MSIRARAVVFAVLAVVLLGSATAFVLRSMSAQGDAARPSPGEQAALDSVLGRPHLMFRSTDRAGGFGVAAAVPLSDPTAPRVHTDRRCDRIYATRGAILCLRQRPGVIASFEAGSYDGRLQERRQWPLLGLPSRARLSPDGSLAATTVFVTGHSYLSSGFSTQTELRYVGGRVVAELEQLDLVLDGRRVAPRDRNYWGVTFRDDRVFYATVATGGRTWLVRGDLGEGTLTSMRSNAECPSLSPDGSRIAYKKRLADDGDGAWQLAVLDLDTGVETQLPSTRGLDDQVEWLDDQVLLYGLPRPDQRGGSDIWSVRAERGARPTLFLPRASSPAVVR